MKNLREKLHRLKKKEFEEIIEQEKEPVIEKNPCEKKKNIEEVINGRFIESLQGKCFVTEMKYHFHPLCDEDIPLSTILNCEALALFTYENLSKIDKRKILFLDTETTGLSRGTGTYVILVGVGFFENETFHVRQYFLDTPDNEAAMISLLKEFFAKFHYIVTFNGKTFDIPLLKTRFTLHKQLLYLQYLPHIDLLQGARRLWKRRLESCSLRSLEKNILNISRIDDTPGKLIPKIYFDYLETGDATPLKGVFEHNVFDIITMVNLAIVMSEIIENPHKAGVVHGEDWCSLGMFYEKLDLEEKASHAFEKALIAPSSKEMQLYTIKKISFFYKYHQRWEKALEIWESLVKDNHNEIYPYEELAKYYEHRQYRYEEALVLVRDIIGRLQREESENEMELGYYTKEEALEIFYHRERRLLGKMVRSENAK